MDINLIDPGCGNIRSVINFFQGMYPGNVNILTNYTGAVNRRSCLVLPGVGHFGMAASFFNHTNVKSLVLSYYSNGFPIIGICLGAQILCESSEESPGSEGLGLIKADCLSLANHPTYRGNIPRVGWSSIRSSHTNGSYYFVHSYYMQVRDDHANVYTCDDGVTAMVVKSNIIAMQFHPEKSSFFGRNLVQDYLGSYA
jgi:glutamine amidotransferase